MTERHEQIALIKRAQLNPITRDYLFAIPNGGSRHPIEARNLKLQGVKPGIPDLMLAYPTKSFHGLFIELKRQKGTMSLVSANQSMMIHLFRKVGYAAKVAFGWIEAWEIIEKYLQSSDFNSIEIAA